MTTNGRYEDLKSLIGESSINLNKALAYLQGIRLASQSQTARELAEGLKITFQTPSLRIAARVGAALAYSRGYTPVSAKDLSEAL